MSKKRKPGRPETRTSSLKRALYLAVAPAIQASRSVRGATKALSDEFKKRRRARTRILARADDQLGAKEGPNPGRSAAELQTFLEAASPETLRRAYQDDRREQKILEEDFRKRFSEVRPDLNPRSYASCEGGIRQLLLAGQAGALPKGTVVMPILQFGDVVAVKLPPELSAEPC